jgi:hypothetical protein
LTSFAIGITIPGVPTHYLAPGGKGEGTPDFAKAESCTIDAKTQLVCGNTVVGSSTMSDMVALMKNTGQTITTGFSVDGNNVLHWKNNPKFSQYEAIKKQPNGEAAWALYPRGTGKYQLYAQLGCPNSASEKHDFHQMMTVGTVKIIPK